PSVGCAKSRLVGEYNEPGMRKGSRSPLLILGKTVGAVLRTRANVKPVFVSPGHRIDLEGSVRLVLECATSFRLPEPTRRADALSKVLKKKCR
ncbi:MAG: endonuclease V, partial [Deltaproteobacteria bacterium]|nr:endonuclease V [Deltaproteobacteria bacterium]